MEIFYKIMEVNVADYSPGLDVSFIMFEARQCSRNPTVVVHNWIVLAFLDIQHFSKYSRETEKTFRRRGWSYIIIWIYYCQICNKDGFCKSEEILETTRSTTVPVFVRSFNPELLVVVGGWGGGEGGRGGTLSLMSFRDERTYCDNQNYAASFFCVLVALFVCFLASELFTLLMFFSSLKISGLRQKSIVTTLLSKISWEYNAVL